MSVFPLSTINLETFVWLIAITARPKKKHNTEDIFYLITLLIFYIETHLAACVETPHMYLWLQCV